MPGDTVKQRPLELHEAQPDVKVITTSSGGATTLLASEVNHVRAAAPASGTHTITLPAAALCAGMRLNFYVTGTAGTGDIAFASNAGDLKAFSVGDTFTAAADYLIADCNGYWWEVIKEVSA